MACAIAWPFGRRRGLSRDRIRLEELGMITIRKAVARRVPPDQIRAGIEALISRSGAAGSGTAGSGLGDDAVVARLRDLAVQLASYRDLQVSVITYEDGSAELEVLHAGPPHHTCDTIDCAKFAGRTAAERGWVVDLADDSALQHATELIRAALLAASAS
jgi:hypothetical protein